MGVLVNAINLGVAVHWCWSAIHMVVGCRFGCPWSTKAIVPDIKFKLMGLMTVMSALQLGNMLLELVVSDLMELLCEGDSPSR